MSIELTERAAERVREFAAKDGKSAGLRLGVKRTGCSGWAYTVALADRVEDDDTVYEDRGVKVLVGPKALDLVEGTRIDFASDGLNRSFVFDNPNVEGECGCGESFTVKA